MSNFKPMWILARDFNRESRALNGATTITIRRPTVKWLEEKIASELAAQTNESFSTITLEESLPAPVEFIEIKVSITNQKINELLNEVLND
ncbi:MAG: hypothetical protein ACK5NC_11535 [Vibrio sp.]